MNLGDNTEQFGEFVLLGEERCVRIDSLEELKEIERVVRAEAKET